MIPNRRLLILGGAILIAQAVLTYALARVEYLPSPPPLDLFPRALGEWGHSQDLTLTQRALDMLAPDDLLNRRYSREWNSADVDFFVAYYKTQHAGRNAHDPKVCLPGSGWEPTTSEVREIKVNGAAEPIPVNYYVVSRDGEEALVLYWFQTSRGVTVDDQAIKVRASRIIHSITDNRTDMALVRIVAPVYQGLPEATERAVRFAGLAYPHLLRQFPPRNRD